MGLSAGIGMALDAWIRGPHPNGTRPRTFQTASCARTGEHEVDAGPPVAAVAPVVVGARPAVLLQAVVVDLGAVFTGLDWPRVPRCVPASDGGRRRRDRRRLVHGRTPRPAAPTRVHPAKGAVDSVVRTLAVEWAPQRIRVNAVAPGWVQTPAIARLIAEGRLDPEPIVARTPLGRLAEPAEIAETVAFLVSPSASFTTGHVVDGGLTVQGPSSDPTVRS